jgi:4,5-DOPA dioxygenase extradiol
MAAENSDQDYANVPRAPALFIGHGSPMNAIEQNAFTAGWRDAGKSLDGVRAILSVSAHWETTRGSFLTAAPQPRLVYDMHGFPEPLYRVKYPAPGAPQLASAIAKGPAPYPLAATDAWGLDHGTWSVLVHLRPAADIPVIQLSLSRELNLADHLALGQELAKLRDMGVAIMGTGNIVHNLRLRRTDGTQYAWAQEFDQSIAALIDDRNFGGTAKLQSLGAPARLSHPTLEHYIPLMYVLGALSPTDTFQWFNHGFTKATLGMRSLIST